MTSYFRQQLERWLGRINVKCDSCLDIGGGQYPVKNRVLSWQVENYKIADNDTQYKPDYITDLNYPTEIKDRFDIIFCLEVSEYLFDPLTAMKNIHTLLKPEGILYMSFCTIYPLHSPPKMDYLRYSKNAIEKLLTEAGFKTWEIIPRVASDGLGSLSDFYSHEKMRPMKYTKKIFDIGYMCEIFK